MEGGGGREHRRSSSTQLQIRSWIVGTNIASPYGTSAFFWKINPLLLSLWGRIRLLSCQRFLMRNAWIGKKLFTFRKVYFSLPNISNFSSSFGLLSTSCLLFHSPNIFILFKTWPIYENQTESPPNHGFLDVSMMKRIQHWLSFLLLSFSIYRFITA